MQIINKDNVNDQVGGSWSCAMGCVAGCLVVPSVNAVATFTAVL